MAPAVVEVTVLKATFAKSLNYFLSFQLDEGEKLRTEVSADTTKPEFKNNTFQLQCPVMRRSNMREISLKICGFVVVKKNNETDDEKLTPSLLGSGALNVSSMVKQLEGGRAVLCDDIPLTRKSKKQGNEDQDIIVGKLQLQLRYSEGAGEWSGGKELHPDTAVCKAVIHKGTLDRSPGVNRELIIEGRIITPEAHQALLAFREDKEANRDTLVKFWPKRIFSTSAGAQEGLEELYHWNEPVSFRVEPRAWQNNKGVRLDLRSRAVGDPYKEPESTEGGGENFESIGGVTLGLGYFHKLQQYNLRFLCSDKTTMDVSLEMQPSFNEDHAFYSKQRNSENLRRVQVQVCGFRNKVKYPLCQPYVKISGLKPGPEVDQFPADNASHFQTCKPLVNPLISGKANLREATAGIQDYQLDAQSKITGRVSGETQLPNWESFPLLDFNAEGDHFRDDVLLEFFHKDGIKFGQSVVRIANCPLDGSVVKKSAQVALSPAFCDEEPEVEEPETDGPEDLLQVKIPKRKPCICEVKLHVWSAENYLSFLEESIEELPNEASSPIIPKLDLEGKPIASPVGSPKSQEDIDLLSYRRPENLDQPPSPELTPLPSRDTTPVIKTPQLPTPSPEPVVSPSRAASHAEHRHVAEEKEALKERMGILTADLSNKQALIDRLIAEVDKRSEAIRSCGTEIVELRKANQQLIAERDAAHEKLAKIEQDAIKEAHTLADPDNVNAIEPNNINEMKRRIALLGKKYENERARNEEVVRRLEMLQEVAGKNRMLLQDFKKLEKAHGTQARYIQELQDENAQIGLYKVTIKTQEKVIVKLEDLLESKLQDGGGSGGSSANQYIDEIERLRERNSDLETKLLNGDFIGDASLQERIKELEEQVANGNSGSGSARRKSTLKGVDDRDEDSSEQDERIQALEEQLVENAKNFAKEIAEARMKIFEFEAMQSVLDD